MDVLLTSLASRLREADTFAAVAEAVIALLGRWPGITAVAVEAHDRTGPCAWFASAGFAPAAGYLDGGPPQDLATAASPALVRPRSDAAQASWVCPLVGCGEVVGALRLRVTPGEAAAGATADRIGELLAAAATLASVRVAQLGGTCDDTLGPRALTARQFEVSVLVARGSTNAEIARLLSISPDAVKKHVSRALLALDVSNRAELAAIASRWRCAAPTTPPPAAIHVELRARRSTAPCGRAA